MPKNMKELNEETGFVLSVKTMIAIGFYMATIIGIWFSLQSESFLHLVSELSFLSESSFLSGVSFGCV